MTVKIDILSLFVLSLMQNYRTIMETALKHMIDVILKYTQTIEDEIKRSQRDLNKTIIENRDQLILDKTKDYFYKEILKQLNEICNNISTIVDYNQQINKLNENRMKIDKHYIKKQIERFDKKHIDKVPRRTNNNPHKKRLDETSSLKYLEFWENYLDTNNDNIVNDPVKKRTNDNTLRKKKKFVSSTTNAFLETPNDNQILKQIDSSDDEIDGNTEAFNRNVTAETEKNEHTKPRIVGVVYKSKIS